MGLDYAWGMSTGKLSFANGVKMKMSVIFGILHMNFGILIKGTNAIFKGNWPIFFLEVVGGLVILNALFGWMDLLVFNKWMHPVNLFSIFKNTAATNYPVGVVYGATDISGAIPEFNPITTTFTKEILSTCEVFW